MATAVLFLPFPSPKLSPNKKQHPIVLHRLRKQYKTACLWELKAQGVRPLKAASASMLITFHPPNANRRDRDNCIGAFKSGQDALAIALGIDDSKFDVSYAPLATPILPNGQIRVDLNWTPREAKAA